MDVIEALQNIQEGIDKASAGVGELVAAQMQTTNSLQTQINSLKGRLDAIDEGGPNPIPSPGVEILARLAVWRQGDSPPEREFSEMGEGVAKFLELFELVGVMALLSGTKTPAIKAAAEKLGREILVLEWHNMWATNTSEKVGPVPDRAKDQVWLTNRVLARGSGGATVTQAFETAEMVRFLGWPNIAPLHNPTNQSLLMEKVADLRKIAEGSAADILFLDNGGCRYAGAFGDGYSVLSVTDADGNETPCLPLEYLEGLMGPEETALTKEVARAADIRFRDNLMIPLVKQMAAAVWADGTIGKRVAVNVGAVDSPYSGKPNSLEGIFDVDLHSVLYAQRSDMAIAIEEHFSGVGARRHTGGGWLQKLVTMEALAYPVDGSNVILLAHRDVPAVLSAQDIELARRWAWGSFLAIAQPSSYLSLRPQNPDPQWSYMRDTMDKLQEEKDRALALGRRAPGMLADLALGQSTEAYDLDLQKGILTVHFEHGDLILNASDATVIFPGEI